MAHRIHTRTAPLDAASLDAHERRWADCAEGERFSWEPADGGLHDGWRYFGAGAAVTLAASGPDPIPAVRTHAHDLFARLDDRVEGASWEPPPAAVFGGVAFAPGAPRASAWEPFGDARFVLPAWVVGVRGDRAFVRTTEPDRTDAHDLLSGFEGPPLAAPDGDPWATLVGQCLAAIAAGTFEKLVAARSLRVALGDGVTVASALRSLRAGDRARRTTVFAFERAGQCFLGATPERLVEVRGASLMADALAGSLPRSGRDDAAEARALSERDKDRREHDCVVRALREALEPLCEAGGVLAPASPEVKVLPTLMHLFTPVRARLRAGVHVLDAVRALHPTPAVGGLPTRGATAWITRHEGLDRGWYAGPVGWFDATGDGAFMVALRSARVAGRAAEVYAGAGIVAGSDAEAERAETAAKMAPMLRALGAAP